ncbi:MAG: DUF559 domain-containing protein [Candidatus Peribacteraceae bacterium]|nr:DUF559 domain-containing protein [Candidatus Peribacteraceae bacterium]
MAHRLIIELDGPVHMRRKEYDADRDACLRDAGYRVLRFLNDEVSADLPSVLRRIEEAVFPHTTNK